MSIEAAAAAITGMAALWLVLQPLLFPRRPKPVVYEPPEPEETARGLALAALKEIEFDRATEKLSDSDYELLKSRYTARALELLRSEPAETDPVESLIAARLRARQPAASAPDSPDRTGPVCRQCGPRPEPDARFCSTCGLELTA